MLNPTQMIQIVQSLALELNIKSPFLAVVAARKEVLKFGAIPAEIVKMDWEAYRVLNSKIRRRNAERTTFFHVDEEDMVISTIKMGMRGSGLKRWYRIQESDGHFTCILSGSTIMA